MYVCVCNAVTERQIKALAEQGITTVDEMSNINGCASTCGTCRNHIEDILQQTRRSSALSFSIPVISHRGVCA